MPVAGSGAFAVSDGFALFTGGYDKRNDYHLFELGRNGNINEVSKFKVTDENRQRLLADLIFGRSDALYIVRNAQVYRCDVQMAAAA